MDVPPTALDGTSLKLTDDVDGTTWFDRLVELVVALSGTPAFLAEAAVARALEGRPRPVTDDEKLGLVARALVTVRHEIDLTERDHRPVR